MKSLALPALLCAALAAPPALGDCRLAKFQALEVIMDGNQPLIEASIDGHAVRALIDTGAERTVVFKNTAEAAGLDMVALGGHFVGVDGKATAYQAKTRDLRIGPWSNTGLTVFVGGHSDHVGMVVGRDLLGQLDLEFDLARNTLNLFVAEDCGDRPLAYWTREWSEVAIRRPPRRNSLHRADRLANWTRPLFVDVVINGVTLKAQLDSGAYTSVLTLEAAAKAGITPGSEGVVPGGRSVGIAGKELPNWVGVFKELTVGDLTVRNARLRMAPLFDSRRGGPDMLLGADFFRALRLYISHKQGKIYFTHNGGPIFQVTGPLLDRLPDTEDTEE
ncbi:MAG TPA: retroviral-like aspartic protease family protein [Azospirillaceae bacterium]|nr:retroviral-like aspartic protease family protein [Azospirillaceae bacterium]